jgi:hypothetical protein
MPVFISLIIRLSDFKKLHDWERNSGIRLLIRLIIAFLRELQNFSLHLCKKKISLTEGAIQLTLGVINNCS